ncbi:hypothetical protein VZ94_10580 [Methylocucumis oryzae]|uniref:Transposase n=1 Tax=Methylocucumis oryzae TaxID=1632867 RepID=A0A0F3ILV0_9GAMM|nr:hypothetical protein VZ94_10580 [Methylocucumis oryzae]
MDTATRTIGIDIAKNIFHLVIQESDGSLTKKKLKRKELLNFIANTPRSLIGLEACGGAHYWARVVPSWGMKRCY